MESENSKCPVFLYFDPCSRMIYKFPLIFITDIEHIKFEILIEELGSSTVWFRGAKYENTDELLRFISKENEKTRKKYREKYGIFPPYVITQCTFRTTYSTCIRTHNCESYAVFLFEDEAKLPECIAKGEVPIFRNAEIKAIDRFNIKTLIKLHNSIVSNCVVRPAAYSSRPDAYVAKINGTLYDARIARVTDNTFYLQFSTIPSIKLFEYYNIKLAEYEPLISHDFRLIDGRIPVGNKECILKILDFINSKRCAMEYASFIIRGDTILSNGCMFKIVQSPTGKWYVKGKMDDFSKVFKCSGMEEIREFATKLFGRRITGIFPECNTREELLILIEKMKK